MEFSRADFHLPTRILFGRGVSAQLPALATEFGKRALVVTGANASRWKALISTVERAGVHISCFTVAGEPEIETVDQALALARGDNCDLVIAIGGGSAIDAGKAVSALLANPGEVLDYLEVVGAGKPITRQAVPFIAAPTTAGTGSEVTRNAVLASPAHRVKASLRSPLMTPRVAVVDAELTVHLPPTLTAFTGMDALTQLIEPLVSCRANPFTDAYCHEALPRAARSLRAAFEDGANLSARDDMAFASLCGGIALSNAGLGAVHGFAGPIGGMFAAPHGAICAALLPVVMAANITALRRREVVTPALGRYDEAAKLLTGNPRARAEDGVAWVKDLAGALGIPKLRAHGISSADVEALVDKATRASSMKGNPLPLTSEELEAILAEAI